MKYKTIKELRYEKKFIIENSSSPKEIEHLIKHNPCFFSEIYHERNVNNIYLDSYDYSNYHQNISGNSDRIKLRIRWYGNIFGLIKNPVLELKIKSNELGEKLQFKLIPFVLDKTFSFNFLKNVFKESDLPFWLVEKLKLFHPTLLNSYKRKYFVSANRKYRITFDTNMIYYSIKSANNSFIDKIENRRFFVIEVKYAQKDYKNAQEVINYFPFRLCAHSKYVRGVELLWM